MWRSDRLAAAIAGIEAEIDAAWAELRAGFPGAGAAELAELVLQDPSEHPWRLVDAAMARSTCVECGARLGAGRRAGGWKPRDEAGWDEHCGPCDLADGFRFAAREVDRPGVPPGNEHAIRVASAVARTRYRYSPRARVGYELLLPDLIDGALPSTPQAQAFKALITRRTPEQCDRVATITEVEELTCGILGE